MTDYQDWTEAYKELCQIITDKIPEINHVDLWRGQIDYLEEEYPWSPNSLFINFTSGKTKTLGGNVQEVPMTIDLIFCLDTLADTYRDSKTQDVALGFMKISKKIHNSFQARSGENFSSMDRIGFGFMPAPQYLNVIRQSYSCIIMDYTGATERGEATINTISVSKQTQPPAPQNTDIKLFDVDM